MLLTFCFVAEVFNSCRNCKIRFPVCKQEGVNTAI